MPNLLERLMITEVSGVDDPANEIPGWMVTKSLPPDDRVILESVAMARVLASTTEQEWDETISDLVRAMGGNEAMFPAVVKSRALKLIEVALLQKRRAEFIQRLDAILAGKSARS
jgi:hypothetical protein